MPQDITLAVVSDGAVFVRQAIGNATVAAASGALGELIEMQFEQWRLTPAEAEVALLALKGNPKPPVKKVKIPSLPQKNKKGVVLATGDVMVANANAADDESKISDMTVSVGESSLLSRPALVKEVQQVAMEDNSCARRAVSFVPPPGCKWTEISTKSRLPVRSSNPKA